MQPHQERVAKERDELAEKIAKLGGFLFGPLFNVLPHDEQIRLVKQLGFMESYLDVIDRRIAAFEWP